MNDWRNLILPEVTLDSREGLIESAWGWSLLPGGSVWWLELVCQEVTAPAIRARVEHAEHVKTGRFGPACVLVSDGVQRLRIAIEHAAYTRVTVELLGEGRSRVGGELQRLLV